MVLIGMCLCKQTPFRHNLSRIQTSGNDFIAQASSMAAFMKVQMGHIFNNLISYKVAIRMRAKEITIYHL